MKGLGSMIRLNRMTLDEKRREQADLERQADAINAEFDRLAAEQAREEASTADALAQANYGAYAQGLNMRRQALRMALTQIEAQLDAKREEIAEVFQDLKKFETLQARREAQAQAEVDRREQQVLDEIALRPNSQKGT